jgi:hypothetical protein
MRFEQPDYLERFLWFVLIACFLLAVGSRIINVRSQPKPVTHYQVDETPTYFAWYFVDTLQDDLRNQFQR